MTRNSARFHQVSLDIGQGSAAVRQAFQLATDALAPQLSASSLNLWAEEGAAMVRRGSGHWEAAAEYFGISRVLVPSLTTRHLLRWARAGGSLASTSGPMAAAFFRASPAVAERIPPGRLGQWAGMGQRLSSSADYADTLACRFFDSTPRFLQGNSIASLGLLGALLAQVAPRSLDLAADVLNLSLRHFPELGEADLRDFLGLGERLAQRNLNALRAFFDAGLGLYVSLDPAERESFLNIVQDLAAASPRGLTTYLSEASRHLAPLLATRGILPLALSARIAGLSTPAAREFIRNASVLTDKLNNQQLADWCRQGEALLAVHEAAGIGYFRLQSREALDALSALSPIVELEEVREVLRLYCQALMGRTVAILPVEKMAERSASWTSAEEVDWDGAAVFAPGRMQEFATKTGNFEAYKVLATHQAGHLEFGTFEFGFERQGEVFSPLRGPIASLQARGKTYFTDFDRFFDLFSERRLARDAFTISEDTRVDYILRREYRGIRNPYHRVQEHAAVHRPDLDALPLREQIVEVVLRMSLEQQPRYAVPVSVKDQLWTAAGLINLLGSRFLTVEDAAEATLRLYVVLRNVPNLAAAELAKEERVILDLSEALYDPAAEDPSSLIQAFLEANQEAEQPDLTGPTDKDPEDQDRQNEEQEYRQYSPVAHRGELRPEMAQAIQKLARQPQREVGQQKETPGQGSVEGLSDGELQEWMENFEAWFDDWRGSDGDEGDVWSGFLLGNLLRSYRGDKGVRKPLIQPEAPHVGEADSQIFTYDEWDYRARAYRPKWCQVRQRVLKEVDGNFFNEALESHRMLVHAVRRQFEMLRPELMGKVKRLLDGEDFDLDAVLEARVERRAGHTPSDKIYWRRHRVERNVAVALLLDMSLSTDERIERDAMRVAREAQTERARRIANKRIIDLEREALVLFIEALEQIGDTYGIFGFSGSGRNDVQFYVIKDCEETLSERVKRRIDGIVPLQGTRMGPAIRHAVAKLEKVAAKTKVLIVLSDGRPQDRDYGTLPWDPEALPRSFLRAGDYSLVEVSQEAMMLDEKEYAVHDTKHALIEAKAKDIVPFCISVDKQGHDYLKVMCGDIGYEVVSDIESLPRRLPSLYRRLTT